MNEILIYVGGIPVENQTLNSIPWLYQALDKTQSFNVLFGISNLLIAYVLIH